MKRLSVGQCSFLTVLCLCSPACDRHVKKPSLTKSTMPPKVVCYLRALAPNGGPNLDIIRMNCEWVVTNNGGYLFKLYHAGWETNGVPTGGITNSGVVSVEVVTRLAVLANTTHEITHLPVPSWTTEDNTPVFSWYLIDNGHWGNPVEVEEFLKPAYEQHKWP